MKVMQRFSPRWPSAVTLLNYGVTLHGLLIIAATLEEQVVFRGFHTRLSGIVFGVPLLAGLTMLYVSIYLRRRKQTAWAVAVLLYVFLLAFIVSRDSWWLHGYHPEFVLRNVVLPAVMLMGLLLCRGAYTVRSDVQSFAASLRFIVLVLVVTLVYGVSGFLLLDKHDFHQEVSWQEAVHHTVDQFDLTTAHELVPHTRRAKAFQDSLSIVSVGAVAYALISLFQPLRVRFSDQSSDRADAERLLRRYPYSSEDFFKVWPHDKLYFYNSGRSAGLAYGVRRGVALVVGDPFGDSRQFDALLTDFDQLCRTNDWTAAYIHTEPQRSELYKRHGFTLQKIGQEAIIDLATFQKTTVRSKYFRHISNRFTKQRYTTELLQPPHSLATLARLRAISREWLAQPGRVERGFMMGSYSTRYLQQCPVLVLRDASGTIQAFINQIPTYTPAEANFDLLRHTQAAPGNSNDFLLLAFIAYLHEQGVARLNLGLCPLAGLAEDNEERSVVSSGLRFMYANGDRFYSFSGLYRFKAKYQPEWSNRYIAYRGGVRNFTRMLNALNRAMKIHTK